MEQWLGVEHGLIFLTSIAVFAAGMATTEYSFYWFITDAGLPLNITDICKLNPNATGCADYQRLVVKESVKLTQIDSLRSIVMLCLTWWLGSASDIIGRKKVLLTNFTGLFTTLTINGIVTLTHQSPLFLIASGVFYDLTGGFAVLLTVLFASVSSSASEEGSRLYRIIMIDLALLLPTLVMAPVGIWIKKYGLDYIYYIVFSCAALVFITLLLATMFYKEAIVYQHNTLQAHFRKIGSSLKQVWFQCNAKAAFLWVLSFSFFVRNFSSTGAGSINQLYLQSPPFSWDPELYSIFSTIGGIIAFFSFVVVGFMSSCKLGHFTILYISYLTFFAYYILFGTLKTTEGLFLTQLICLFHSGTLSITRALMAKLVEKDLQGTLFVIPGILQSIGQSTGALTFSTLYQYMKTQVDSLYYLFTPFLFAIASTLLLISHYIYSEKVKHETPEEDDEDQALIDTDENTESFRNVAISRPSH